MSKKGRASLEEKVGLDRMKHLLDTMDIPSIAGLVCDHFIDREDKEKCKACRRAIYRAKRRIEESEKKEKLYLPIDDFTLIPEIQNFINYMKAKKAGFKDHVSRLCRYWQWIRESGKPELVQTQRPALWDSKHVQYCLMKIDELKITRYAPVQSFRMFFESQKRFGMLKEPLLRARRKDMRSPNGRRRKRDRFTPRELNEEILPLLNEDEAFTVKMHLTCKGREGDRGKGSLLNTTWEDIKWEDNFYGFSMVTMTVYEPKTKGGTYWGHIPVDLWFKDLSKELLSRYKANKALAIPEKYVFPFNYDQYLRLWQKISKALNKKFEPHDCRRSPSGWLRDLDLSDLAIGQYDPNSDRATGFAGVGWENPTIFFNRYGKKSPHAIYDKSKRLNTKWFDGLILKILENK